MQLNDELKFKADGIQIVIQEGRLEVAGVLVWKTGMTPELSRERWECAVKGIKWSATETLRAQLRKLLGVD